MSLSTEITIIVGVILLQIYYFAKTWTDISILQKIFANIGDLQLQTVSFNNEIAQKYTKAGLDKKLRSNRTNEEKYISLFTDDAIPFNRKLTKTIRPRASYTNIFGDILSSTNTYLLRNHDNTIDFKIIKDIAERKVEAQINQIESTLQIPLYLGLLGTIVGIIVGISGLENINSGEALTDQIPNLLTGVATAMFASFMGLLLTIVGTGIIYKRGLEKNDSGKHEYFDFIQEELISSVRGVAANFKELQDKLAEINTGFGKEMNITLKDFTKSISESEKNISEKQTKLLEAIRDTNFETIKEAFDKIDTSSAKLQEKLQIQVAYIDQIYNAMSLMRDGGKDTRKYMNDILNEIHKSYEQLQIKTNAEIDAMKSKYNELNPEFKELKKLSGIESALNKMNETSNQTLNELKQEKPPIVIHDSLLVKAIEKLNEKDASLVRAIENLDKSIQKSSIGVKRRSGGFFGWFNSTSKQNESEFREKNKVNKVTNTKQTKVNKNTKQKKQAKNKTTNKEEKTNEYSSTHRPSNSITVLYSPTPKNNIFIGSRFSETVTSDEYIYVITILDDRQALYSLVSNQDSLKNAFDNFDKYLVPCFDVKGNPTFENHRVMKEGKLSKSGEDWKITERSELM